MRRLFLFSLLFTPLALAAGEYSSTHTVTLIHNAVVKIKGNCCPNLYLSTKVGHWKNGVCEYEQETQPRIYGYCGPEATFPLDGEQLEQMVGAEYDCAATVVTDSSNQYTGIDEYRLISADGKYIATSPNTGWIELGMQCASN